MIHSCVRGKGHSSAGWDRDSGSRGTGVAAYITAKVVGGERCDGGIVVCVFADVLVLGAFLAVGGEVLEDVVGLGDVRGGEGQDGSSDCLHVERRWLVGKDWIGENESRLGSCFGRKGGREASSPFKYWV